MILYISDDYSSWSCVGCDILLYLKVIKLVLAKKQLESKLSTLYAGRLAEDLIYGEENISTGASNDIKVATNIARNMVTQWGFSDKLGANSLYGR